MEYNIVTNYRINMIFKNTSKYYRVDLGRTSTQESGGGDRSFSKRDDFAYFYNTRYRTGILGQGKIGNIRFYTDHYILADQLAFYYDREEFIFEFDEQLVREKGVDFYLGHLIKKIETELKVKEPEVAREKLPTKEEKVADPGKISITPGAVRYEDVKAWMEKKNADRLKI